MSFSFFRRILILTAISFVVNIYPLTAQEDSMRNKKVDSSLTNRKGLLNKLVKTIMTNRTLPETVPVRNDLLFKPYQDKIIRQIIIHRLDFGISITDTSRRFRNQLTQLANDFHHKTNERVIRNNLFFKKGEKLVPYLLADNERHLRDLPYLQDAQINVIMSGNDSVDIIILTKDVLSIGGSFRMHNTQKVSVTLSEDNLAGWGHELLIRTLFDNTRKPKFGFGGEYVARNIKGSFIDLYGGHLSYNKNINTGTKNEIMSYAGFVRPLVNPYMKFTYAAEAAYHNTENVYLKDSAYETDHQYKYYNYDVWLGWNTGAFKVFGENKENRVRTLLGTRYLRQSFSEVPLKYQYQYNYMYTDMRAMLTSLTIFRQDFYKTKNVLGFGRSEDIPEGADLSLIAGWTKKAGIERPYIGIDLERYFFAANEDYYSYTIKADGYLRNKNLEDINLLFNLNYFSRLLSLGKKWKERNFITAGIAHQFRRILNEPLFLQSDFGLREWRDDTLTFGNTRATIKAESVFFTPWSLANFRFAPFVFGNLCLFTQASNKISTKDLYNSIGGGLRTRNESLIFETIEVKAFYFPKENFLGEHWRFEFNTRVRFRYSGQFIKKPSFVDVNRR